MATVKWYENDLWSKKHFVFWKSAIKFARNLRWSKPEGVVKAIVVYDRTRMVFE